MNRSATYLYGVARSGTEVSANLPGIEEAEPVRALEVAGLCAVVSAVPVEAFESQTTTDLSWLVPRALRHEHVIETVRASGPILPVRFGSLFTTREALETWAVDNRESIESFLRHVTDKDEWTVKLNLEPGSALENLAAADPHWAALARGLSSSPGTRYFQEKRLREDARKGARKAAGEAAARLRAAACALAEERLLAPRKPETVDIETVLHAVYLVPRHAMPEFQERTGLAVGPLSCLKLETSGPWPPSHFCPPLAAPAP